MFVEYIWKVSCCVAVGDKMVPLEEYILFLHFLRSLLVVSKGRVFYLLFHVSESLDHLKKNYMSKTTKLIIAWFTSTRDSSDDDGNVAIESSKEKIKE